MIILIGLGVSLTVFLVFFWFFSNADGHLSVAATAPDHHVAKNFTISSKDIENIAGDDVMVTQLDLARAYLETDRKNLAKSILNNVAKQGNAEQRQEAKRLLTALHKAS